MKGKHKISKPLVELAAAKAFRSADISQRNNLTFAEIRLWISFNAEFETFLNDFSCPPSTKIDSRLFKPFVYELDYENFDKNALNTQAVKLNISRSLTLNFKKNLDKSLDK